MRGGGAEVTFRLLDGETVRHALATHAMLPENVEKLCGDGVRGDESGSSLSSGVEYVRGFLFELLVQIPLGGDTGIDD
jgi:hypothetical protein